MVAVDKFKSRLLASSMPGQARTMWDIIKYDYIGYRFLNTVAELDSSLKSIRVAIYMTMVSFV